ncbi:MAG: DUF3570 domain-containing protein [Gammaproteobacteria bacterium]|nr:DUF3570 domain-containing protein [Gammaproteobacteria bacterium]
MQLKNLKTSMGVAVCSLLQATVPAVEAAESDWDVDTAVLIYSESDGRVSAVEPAILAGRALNDDERIDLRLVVDALTGATPNGAHPSAAAQTFTTPSGNSSYTTKAGELPVDDTFRDGRVSFGADWEMAIDRLSKITWGGNISKEYDYLSLGSSVTYAHDFNDRNTTLTTAFALNNDTISPEGGIPSELLPMRSSGSSINREGIDDTKNITDFMLGVTQVVSRSTVMQLNVSFGQIDGYQNDPFKVVSVIDPVTGLPATDTGSSFFDTDTTGNLPYVYERRPDSRQRSVIFFKTVHHFDEDVINFSYRYYDDDWDVNSHTLDLRYRYELKDSYLQPHLRYYRQGAASFYTHDLKLGADVHATTGAVSQDYATSDYRLAESTSVTIGLKYGIPLGNDSEFSIRGEVITQTVDDGTVPVGEETDDLDAFVLQLNYSLLW